MLRIQMTRWILPIVAVSALAWTCRGLAQDPNTGQKVGEKVDETVQNIKDGLRKAGNATKEQFSKTRTAVHNMGIESRVYGRIHWDKALNDASIDLSVSEDGVVTLNGTVANTKAKTRAVELTKETVGVTKVVDQLALRPVTTTTVPE